MSTQMKIMKSTKDYSESLETAIGFLRNADAILIGAGAGLSASGGMDYSDELRAKTLFPEHYACGLTSTMEILSAVWMVTPDNVISFWSIWCRHFNEIAYRTPLLEPYRRLFSLMRGKAYYIISTNVDGQFARAGFPEDKRFEPQGSYALFQCSKPCREEVFENRELVERMQANMPSPFAVRAQDIPRCPHCGDLLMPNLRSDGRFVEAPHMKNHASYASFIEEHKNSNMVLLELGVGLNSPGVIRYPFERIVHAFDNARLVRINLTNAGTRATDGKSVGVQADINMVLGDLLNAGL